MPFIIALLIFATVSDVARFEELAQQAGQARDSKRLEEALGLYKKALNLNRKWEEGWWNAGSIAYDINRYSECSQDFRRLTELKPDLAPAWTMAGLCDYRLRDFPAALKDLQQAQKLGFKEDAELSRSARLHLALVLTKTGRFETALPVLAELTRAFQKTPEIGVAAGIAGLRQAWLPAEVPEGKRELVLKLGDAMTAGMELDYKTAIAKFEAVAAEYPMEANVHFRFGAFLMEHAPDRGIEELKKAVDLEQGHIPALVGLTMIYIDRNDPQAAMEYAEKAVKASPGDYSAHIALGRTWLAKDDAADAVKELEIATILEPDNAVAHLNLATAYARTGKAESARKQREEFKRLTKLIDSTSP